MHDDASERTTEVTEKRPGHRGSALCPLRPLWLILFAALFLTACGGARTIAPGTPAPDDLALTLFRETSDGKLTYFDLSRQGVLSFAGGREARLRAPQPVLKLTPEQRQQVWDIIARHQLLAAENHPFESPRKVMYEVTIAYGFNGHYAFRCVDESPPPTGTQPGAPAAAGAAPGARELHDALFKMQADVRYKLPGIGK